SFNSATAHRRGEGAGGHGRPGPRPPASIRPRLTAVGKLGSYSALAVPSDASIRPRLTAVGKYRCRRTPVRSRRASIRPRLTAVGKPGVARGHGVDGRHASIRPRLTAVGKSRTPPRPGGCTGCFNSATAHRRGEAGDEPFVEPADEAGFNSATAHRRGE